MDQSTVTQKGQITIPIDLRKEFDIAVGDKVEFKKVGDQIILKPIKKTKLMELCGLLPKPKKPLTIDEIQQILETQES